MYDSDSAAAISFERAMREYERELLFDDYNFLDGFLHEKGKV